MNIPIVQSDPTLRRSLFDQEPIISTFVMIPRVEIIEMLAVAGYDAVIVDLEHGPIGTSQLPALASFATASNIHAIARIPELSSSRISTVLDAGFDGVMVPHIATAEGAATAMQAARFPPDGHRSFNPYVRGASYDATAPEAFTRFNNHAAVIGMLEGKGALDELDDIIATPGLDCLFVGPIDLSGELGYPGEPEHPDVVRVIQQVFERCRDVGVASGVYAPTPERASHWLERGASLVAVSADSAMILHAFLTTRDKVNTKVHEAD